jgi:hypothetical protein
VRSDAGLSFANQRCHNSLQKLTRKLLIPFEGILAEFMALKTRAVALVARVAHPSPSLRLV